MLCFSRCNGTTLRYFKDLQLIVGGRMLGQASIMMDDGANVDLMDDEFRRRNGIKMFAFKSKLMTSVSTSADVLGITEIIGIKYGEGPGAIRVARPFLVAPGMKKLYDVLIGNQDTVQYSATICSFSNTYTMRRPGQKDLILATVSRFT